MKKAFGVGAICLAFMAAVGTPPLFAQDQNGPLAALPSKPGPHVEKIKALGDNEWLNLGSPAPDPKWGKARGSAWGAFALAPDKRGAFLFGDPGVVAVTPRSARPLVAGQRTAGEQTPVGANSVRRGRVVPPLECVLRGKPAAADQDGRIAGGRVTAKTTTVISAIGRLKGMEQSPQEKIEAIIRSLEAKGLGFLRTVIQNTTSTDEERTRAWTDLCETRHAEAIGYALSCADHVSPADWSPEEWVQAHLHLVGPHRESQSLRRLCPDSHLHLVFPEGFFEPETRPPWLARVHPTWKLPVSVRHVSFGGSGEGRCSLCAGALHRLLVLDPMPPVLGVTGRTRLELATCLSCLGWERQPLFYRHDPTGSPSHIGYDGPHISPQFPVGGPLREAVVGLAETPRRWFWQAGSGAILAA